VFCALIKAEAASQYAHAVENLARLSHTIRNNLTLIAVGEIQDNAEQSGRDGSSMSCSDSELTCDNTDPEDMVDSTSSDSDRERLNDNE
jgi:hypothetical protein